jgi:hypothetical protein
MVPLENRDSPITIPDTINNDADISDGAAMYRLAKVYTVAAI